MTQQIINIGAVEDDGTGDHLRVSFDKCNQNFTELYGADITFLTTTAAATIYQPLDADLTAIAALTGTNTIYYRSAANTWSPVNISTGLAFAGGNLTATVTNAAPVGAEYITSTADATLTAERVLTDTATVTWDRTTAGQIKANAVGGGTSTTAVPQGRLTLQTLTPVMTATQAAKTTIFYTPYQGNLVPIYDGTNFSMTTFAELSALTTDTTKSPAAIGVSKVNDWYVWSDAGTLRIGHGPDWTNDTTRSAGTALTMVKGIWLNNAAITNGPAASRGTYVGTTRSNASSQLDWIVGGSDTAGILAVWNAYNRVIATANSIDTTATYTYNSTTIRQKRLSANNSIAFVSGLQEDAATAYVHGFVSNNTDTTTGVFGIGVDSTTVMAPFASQGISLVNASTVATARHQEVPVIGYHIWNSLEACNANVIATFIGPLAGPPARTQAGMVFEFKM